MLKVLKPINVVKILLFLSIIIIVYQKIDFSGETYTKAYTNQPSYSQNDTIHFYASSDVEQSGLHISTLSGKKVCFIKGKFGHQDIQKDAWKNGFGYKQTQEYPAKDFKPGIYLINKTYPFVIKGDTDKKYDITIVFPYGTLSACSYSGGLNFFGWGMGRTKKRVNQISLFRPLRINESSLQFEHFIQLLKKKYNINFITDLDMNKYANIKNTKALLFFGRNNCWTFKQKDNYSRFINKGGNAIFFCTYCMQTVYWYNASKRYLIKNKINKFKPLSWDFDFNDSIKSYYYTGFSYHFGGIPIKSKSLRILKPQSPMFRGISFKNNIIPLISPLYTSLPLKGANPPQVDINKAHMNSSEILAFIKLKKTAKEDEFSNNYCYGLISVSHLYKDGGFSISMGTDAWCYKYNWERPQIEKVIFNAIDYAVKGH